MNASATKKAATKPAQTDPATFWERLAAPFDQADLERLPRNLQSGDRDKGRCTEGSRYTADGFVCNGYHARSVHLDYVGHAGITMRLNSVCGPGGWKLSPMASQPSGLPLMERGEFWAVLAIRDPLTGDWVEHIDVAANFSSTQEALGDVLRRTAMRFGVGTYLWSKSDTALEMKRAEDVPPPTPARGEESQERPYGQRDGASGPPPRPQYVQAVYDALGLLNEDQKRTVGTWWDQTAEAGRLPARANMVALTPPQAEMVTNYIGTILEGNQPDPPAADDPEQERIQDGIRQDPPSEDEPPF